MSVLSEEISISRGAFACPNGPCAGVFWFNKYVHTTATEVKCASCGTKWEVNPDGSPDFANPI